MDHVSIRDNEFQQCLNNAQMRIWSANGISLLNFY